MPDNVIQDEAEQEDRVPVRPPAQLASLLLLAGRRLVEAERLQGNTSCRRGRWWCGSSTSLTASSPALTPIRNTGNLHRVNMINIVEWKRFAIVWQRSRFQKKSIAMFY